MYEDTNSSSLYLVKMGGVHMRYEWRIFKLGTDKMCLCERTDGRCLTFTGLPLWTVSALSQLVSSNGCSSVSQIVFSYGRLMRLYRNSSDHSIISFLGHH